jgi:hypothetical protein
MCIHRVTDRWVMFVAGTPLLAATSTSVLRPSQPPVYWIMKDISLWIKVSEVWNSFPVQPRGNAERVNLLSVMLHPFVILDKTQGQLYLCIDNSTSSPSLLRSRSFNFYHLTIISKIAEFHKGEHSIGLILIISINSVVLPYFQKISSEFTYQLFALVQWHSPHNL